MKALSFCRCFRVPACLVEKTWRAFLCRLSRACSLISHQKKREPQGGSWAHVTQLWARRCSACNADESMALCIYYTIYRPRCASVSPILAERGAPSPRLLEAVVGKPSSSLSNRASVAGLLPRQRSIPSRGSISSSTRPPTTPSPLATPERRSFIAGTSNIAGRHGPGTPSSSSSPTSVKIGSSSPGGGIGEDGVGADAVAKEGRTASVGRTRTDNTRLFRRMLPQEAATTPGSTTSDEVNCDEEKGRGLLPARRRVSEALLPGGSSLEMGQVGVADGAASRAEGGAGGQMAPAPKEKWRVAGSLKQGQDKHAPAWR